MTQMASAGGGGGGWTPPASLWSWKADFDPTSTRYNLNPDFHQWIDQLLGTSAGAFGEIESQLLSTAELADITAQGLNDAKAASWQGQAGDQYRSTLSKLPADLNLVSENYHRAYTAVSSFADTSLNLKRQYQSFLDQLKTLKGDWTAALEQSYPSADVGWAAIRKLQDEISQVSHQGMVILQNSIDAQNTLQGALNPLAGAAPHEGILTRALGVLKDFWHGMTGTWGAIKNFVNDPTWGNLGTMSSDLAVDAGVIALAAAMPEGAAGLGMIDLSADGTIVGISEAAGDGARALQFGAGALNTEADVGQGNYAAAAFDAWGESKGIDDEIDNAVSDASLLDTYSSVLSSGIPVDSLSKEDIDALKELVPDYQDPKAVAEAAADANKDLAQAALLKDPKDFLQEHFITDPLEGAVAGAIDGNGNGNGSGNGG
jgi:uncharacterized protein YukE